MGLTPVAHGYNRPERESEIEASFLDLGTAQAYADEYGGTVEGRGTAFVVRDADHAKAKDDLREAQRAVPADAPAVASDVDERVARAVAAESAKLRAEFEAEREAFKASQGAAPTPATGTEAPSA